MIIERQNTVIMFQLSYGTSNTLLYIVIQSFNS